MGIYVIHCFIVIKPLLTSLEESIDMTFIENGPVAVLSSLYSGQRKKKK